MRGFKTRTLAHYTLKGHSAVAKMANLPSYDILVAYAAMMVSKSV